MHITDTRRRFAINGDEVDAYSDWRKVLCSFQRAGAVKKIKVRTHRRERQQAKAELRREEW